MLIVCSAVPDVLSFFKTELRNTNYKLASWQFHAGMMERLQSFLSYIHILLGTLYALAKALVPAVRQRETRLYSITSLRTTTSYDLLVWLCTSISVVCLRRVDEN